MTTRHEHAVVIGSSIAGLLAANVLRDHFDQVTVLDRNRLPAGPQMRRGTPHARHVQTYWLGGLQAVERMLPGYPRISPPPERCRSTSPPRCAG